MAELPNVKETSHGGRAETRGLLASPLPPRTILAYLSRPPLSRVRGRACTRINAPALLIALSLSLSFPSVSKLLVALSTELIKRCD